MNGFAKGMLPNGLSVQDLTLAGKAGITCLDGVGLAAFRAESCRAALLFSDMLPVDLHVGCLENPRAGAHNLGKEFLLVLFLLCLQSEKPGLDLGVIVQL